MKRLAGIIVLMMLAFGSRAELPVTTNASIVRFASSYYTLNCAGVYADSGKYLYWNTNNIRCYEENRSGGGIQEANENRLERRGLALWANGSQWWGIIQVDNNGGYTTTNQVYAQLTNTLNAPGLLFNGTAYTNEGGWANSHAGQIKWLTYGDIPQPVLAAEAAPMARNQAMTNSPLFFGNYGYLDVFTPIFWNYGRSNDIFSAANLWQSSLTASQAPLDGEHPGPAGALLMAINENLLWMDTNVNTCIIDGGAGTLSLTQHCAVSGITASGNTVSFTWKADRHSMGFDIPDGTITNSALAAFAMQPALSNAFFESFTITNLNNGVGTVSEDGSNILTQTISSGTLSFNLFSVTNGAVWAQRKEVVGRCRDKLHCDRVTLVFGSAGDGQGEVTYDSNSQAQWNTGKRGDTLISSLATPVANLNSYDALIWAAATPTNHTFTITVTQTTPRPAPFHR